MRWLSLVAPALRLALLATLVGVTLVCERPESRPEHGPSRDRVEPAAVVARVEAAAPWLAASATEQTGWLARIDGHSVRPSQFRAFLDRARGRGYRPATTGEAMRLLRASLREQALELEVLRRSRAGAPLDSDSIYRELLQELTGASPAGARAEVSARDSAAEPGEAGAPREVAEAPTLARIRARHRARIQREVVLDRLLERAEVEIDHEKLAGFVSARFQSELPPLPPGSFFSSEGTS